MKKRKRKERWFSEPLDSVYPTPADCKELMGALSALVGAERQRCLKAVGRYCARTGQSPRQNVEIMRLVCSIQYPRGLLP